MVLPGTLYAWWIRKCPNCQEILCIHYWLNWRQEYQSTLRYMLGECLFYVVLYNLQVHDSLIWIVLLWLVDIIFSFIYYVDFPLYNLGFLDSSFILTVHIYAWNWVLLLFSSALLLLHNLQKGRTRKIKKDHSYNL